jgi:tRNA (guanine26-N2/guanine27-N2)-dimethyltransferase
LENLPHTGLRSVRYAKEIEGLDFVIANDLDEKAVEAIHRNREYNGVDPSKLRTTKSDAAFLLHKLKNDMTTQAPDRLDFLSVVDLDPYGGASPFLDGAVSTVCEGGLLAVTCTDLAVLCGNYAESCWAKYGAMPPKRTEYCHEMALRIVLGSISSHASRHHRHIVPVMSMFADFYVRVFVRVYKHGGELKKVPSKNGYVMQCTTCDSREIQKIGKFTETTPGNVKFSQGYAPVVDQKCSDCGGAWKMGGPMWMDPIHNEEYLKRALEHLEAPDAPAKYGTHKRMLGTITNMLDEMKLPDTPFFYTISQLANTLHLQTPKLDAFRSALVSLGYKVASTHCAPGAVKTDAPYSAVLDVMRSWHAISPAKLSTCSPNSPAFKILSVPPTRTASFDILEEAKCITHTRSGEKLGRYPVHPPNWGPGSKAGRKRDSSSMVEELLERRKENQGKYSAKKKAKLREGEAPSDEGQQHAQNIASSSSNPSSVRISSSSSVTSYTSSHYLSSSSSSLHSLLRNTFYSLKKSLLSPSSLLPLPSHSHHHHQIHSRHAQYHHLRRLRGTMAPLRWMNGQWQGKQIGRRFSFSSSSSSSSSSSCSSILPTSPHRSHTGGANYAKRSRPLIKFQPHHFSKPASSLKCHSSCPTPSKRSNSTRRSFHTLLRLSVR